MDKNKYFVSYYFTASRAAPTGWTDFPAPASDVAEFDCCIVEMEPPAEAEDFEKLKEEIAANHKNKAPDFIVKKLVIISFVKLEQYGIGKC